MGDASEGDVVNGSDSAGVECLRRRRQVDVDSTVATSSTSEHAEVGEGMSCPASLESMEPKTTDEREINRAQRCSYASHTAGHRSCARRTRSIAAGCPGQNFS